MVYEMLAGRTPFQGTTTREIVTRRFRAPPPDVREFRAGDSIGGRRGPASVDDAGKISAAGYRRGNSPTRWSTARRRLPAFARARGSASRALNRAATRAGLSQSRRTGRAA
jgi:hypothetical protein